jgi:hypothetical protein
MNRINKNISEKTKREAYLKAFGQEFDSPLRKQAPLPIDMAYKVARNRLIRQFSIQRAKEFDLLAQKLPVGSGERIVLERLRDQRKRLSEKI